MWVVNVVLCRFNGVVSRCLNSVCSGLLVVVLVIVLVMFMFSEYSYWLFGLNSSGVCVIWCMFLVRDIGLVFMLLLMLVWVYGLCVLVFRKW